MKKRKALSLLFTLCITATIISNSVFAEDGYGIIYADDTYDTYSSENSNTEQNSEDSENSENSENSHNDENSEDSEDSYSEQGSEETEEYHEIAFGDNSQRQATPTPIITDLFSDSDTINYKVGVTTNAIPGWPQSMDISAQSAIVLEDSTNTVLYAKSMDAPMSPASTVKLMTLLLALENGNLSDSVVVTSTGVSGIIDGGPNVSIQEGEIFTLEQCLYAMMISSANDMALQIAEHIGGTVDNFVQMMNIRAEQLGCTNTVFTNPTGVPDENMHVTAHDMALIVQAGIKNEDFKTIIGTNTYTIPPTNVSGGERVLSSPFPLTNPASDFYYDGCIGGKSGYTETSGDTLACAASRNDMDLICVAFGGGIDTAVTDTINLLNYGYSNFSYLDVSATDFSILSGGKLLVPNGTTLEQLSTQDTLLSDGQILRSFSFNGTAIGTALADLASDGDTGIDTSGTEHMREAREFTENKSMIPYGIIGAVGLLLVILLIIRIIKVARR